jgi:hypothetical protein
VTARRAPARVDRISATLALLPAEPGLSIDDVAVAPPHDVGGDHWLPSPGPGVVEVRRLADDRRVRLAAPAIARTDAGLSAPPAIQR